MPRGKRTVYGVFCTKSGNRLGTLRYHKQDKMGKSYKEHVEGMKKYCPKCKVRVEIRIKEERHAK